MDVRRNARVTHGADQNRAELAPKVFERVRRQRHAVLEVALGAPIKRHELEREAAHSLERFQDLDGLARHLNPDAITRDDGNPLGLRWWSEIRHGVALLRL